MQYRRFGRTNLNIPVLSLGGMRFQKSWDQLDSSEISYEEQNKVENIEITGFEPVLGGQLAEKAVWVDEAKCIGCQYCVHVASNTFLVDEFHGRSRAIRQDGDSVDVIQEAIDTCPVDCIHWVKFEELDDLENSLDRDMFQSFGKPPRMNKH